MRIAVIGAGVAGLTAAWLLAPRHDVVVYEADGRPGGHTNTFVVPGGPDAGTAIDTGFIVYNEVNYPGFVRLLARLGVASQASDMTFSYHRASDGFHYAGTGLDGLFSQRRHLASPRFWRMLLDLGRFNGRARRDLARGGGGLDGVTLGEYVARLGLGTAFREHYLVPMGAAIWSTRPADVPAFPAAAFARFFDNHGLLRVSGQPRWRTVTDGSRTYVQALVAGILAAGGQVRLAAPVSALARDASGVTVAAAVAGAVPERFDRAIVATHADQAMRLLAEPTPDERRLLGAWRYTRNRAVLHTDATVLPPRRRAWASWNYEEEPAKSGLAPVCVSYYMNRLQRLRTRQTYCVTLNRQAALAAGSVLHEVEYTHPYYDFRALATQPELPSLNGVRHTYYCGSYFRWGFHEDAVASAVAAARALGAEL